MSELLSLHKLVVGAALVLAACGGKKAKAPEADPAVAKDIATRLLGAMPSPSSTRECTDADVMGVPAMTYRSLLTLAGRPTADTEATLKTWLNPPELDAPFVRTLVDASSNETAKRRAAAELERAKAVIIYRIDYANAPLALAVKHPIRDTIHTRTLRFDNGRATCVTLVSFQSDKEKSDWAIARSDKPIVDPEVVKALQDDLTVQWLKVAPGHVQAAAPTK